MINAVRSLRRSRSNGTPLPYIPELEDLYSRGTVFRTGQIAMLAGRPGSQKSGMAMWLAVKWGLPTLYVSGDMSPYTASTRLASLYSGLTSDEVGERMKDDDATAELARLMAGSPIQFLYSASPTLEDIDANIEAWVETWDSYPSVVIIDNLIDVAAISDSDHQNLLMLLQEFKGISRPGGTNAFLLVVHHNKEDGKPLYPAGVRGIQNLVTQTPELIMSVALDQTGQRPIMRVSTVKDRSGPCDASGEKYIELLADPARTSFARMTFYAGFIRPEGQS